MEDEKWKYVSGYDNLYQVSSLGRVKSCRTGIILKPFDNKGYWRVGLSLNSKQTKFLVHRLVAKEFIPNPENKPQINHKDLNKRNNHFSNLEWVNNQDNVTHAIDNKDGRLEYLQDKMSTIGSKCNHIGVEASKKPVSNYDPKTFEQLGEYESAREAARITGSNYKGIPEACTGRIKTHNGFAWKFV